MDYLKSFKSFSCIIVFHEFSNDKNTICDIPNISKSKYLNNEDDNSSENFDMISQISL